jgi:hypothetical protein
VVGVDRSAVQLDSAIRARDRLGLDNLELTRADITELTPGEQDYIVAHGVFSWVPPEVQERIFAIMAAHLAEEGLAYISYNALPGWGVRGQVRHVMCAQAPFDAPPSERIDAARAVLETLTRTLENASTPYQLLLRGEVELARGRSDAYLLHEFLAPTNEAFHAEAFQERAAAHGLRFVAELSPVTWDSWGERFLRRELATAARAPEDMERWMDLLHYRQFRATVLGRASVAHGPPEPLALLARCRVAGAIRAVERRPSLDAGVTEVFVASSGVKITAAEPILKAALIEVGRAWPRDIPFEELTVRVLTQLGLRRARSTEEDLTEEERSALARDLVELEALGHLDLRVRELPVAPRPTERPAVTSLTRFEAERHGWVSTPMHAMLRLDPLERELVRVLDGSRDVVALTEATLAAVREGRVAFRTEEGAVEDEAALRSLVPGVLGQKMLRFCAHGLLRPEAA